MTSNVFTIDRIVKCLHVDINFLVDDSPNYYIESYNEYIKQGYSEIEAEEKANKAESEASQEVYTKWKNAFESIAETAFEQHGLVLTFDSEDDTKVTVEPKTSWEDTAKHLIATINGYGSYYFTDIQEFMESGPWTAEQAVLEHLHWIAKRPEVYSEISWQKRLDNKLR